MIVLPIRTESVVRRSPTVNYILIVVNVLCFLVFDARFGIPALALLKEEYLFFQSHDPRLLQFFGYQFMHADAMHLLGNMLFLWVFGNSVNGKMGDGPYLIFYIAGGVFAAWGYAVANPTASYLLGASGSVAAITTAYLALFPRSHVTVLLWFFFIYFIEVPAMLLIGVKVIVWDNMVAPNLGGREHIAYGAHLAGYLFGFTGSLLMLAVRGLPRDQFDILSVWKRWRQRRSWETAMSDPARAQYGDMARPIITDPQKLAEEESRLERIADLRTRIGDAYERGDIETAVGLYEQLLATSAAQCMSERQQLDIARHLYGGGRFRPAAMAFERFIDCYPGSWDGPNVHLLLGIIYARDLREYEAADRHLTESISELRDQTRRAQCLEWLTNVRTALGRPMPEAT